jgi:hypothetical protein
MSMPNMVAVYTSPEGGSEGAAGGWGTGYSCCCGGGEDAEDD